jgi:hypothetical protein
VRALPRLCEFYPGICLTTEEKARKNLSQGKKNLSQIRKNLNQSTVYMLPKTPTHYKTLTNTQMTYLLQKNDKFVTVNNKGWNIPPSTSIQTIQTKDKENISNKQIKLQTNKQKNK